MDAGDDGEVTEEEIIDYFFDWDDEDEDDATEVAAAIAEDFVEFEAAISALSNISTTDASEINIIVAVLLPWPLSPNGSLCLCPFGSSTD